jgi:hypothetical protein
MFRCVGISVLLLAFLAPSGVQAQRPSFGPLTFEEGAPISRMSYTPMMESADVAPAGSTALDLYLGLSNVFEYDSASTYLIFVDMERLITAATVRWGVTEGFEVGGRVTLETRSGGFLDPAVAWYHNLLGLGQAKRDLFPEEAYRYVLGDGAGDYYIDVGPTSMALQDVRLFAKWRLLRSADERSVLSLRGVTRVPTHKNIIGEERTDVGLMALGRVGVGAWYLHGMLGASTARAAHDIGPVLTDRSVFFSFAVERSFGASWAGIFQYQFSTPALKGIHDRELDWPLSDVIFGLAGRLGEQWKWNVSFQEDLPADAPAIDFTIGARIQYNWR